MLDNKENEKAEYHKITISKHQYGIGVHVRGNDPVETAKLFQDTMLELAKNREINETACEAVNKKASKTKKDSKEVAEAYLKGFNKGKYSK